MDASRLRTGELIAAVSAVILFIVMFLPWFGVDASGGVAEDVAEEFGIAINVPDLDFNAWEAFGFIDLVLLVTIVVAIGLALASATASTPAVPIAASALVAGLGILSTILVLYRVINPPSELGREFWLWIGLIAAAGIAYGGWRAMQEEGTASAGRGERRVRRGAESAEPPPPPPPSSGTRGQD